MDPRPVLLLYSVRTAADILYPDALYEVISRLPTPPSAAFVCGSNGFLNAIADGAIDAGITSNAIRTERYGG
jgi:ferredoxin-NADP reductase